MTQQEFIVSLEEKGIVLSEKQIEQFEKYYEICIGDNGGQKLWCVAQHHSPLG